MLKNYRLATIKELKVGNATIYVHWSKEFDLIKIVVFGQGFKFEITDPTEQNIKNLNEAIAATIFEEINKHK